MSTDDESDLCELTVTELLAEFSDIKLAGGKCVPVLDKHCDESEVTGLVYVRQVGAS